MTIRLVRQTAKDICGAHYELDRSTRFRQFWPNQRDYIRYNWPHFVEAARATLARMLGNPMVPQYQKDEIAEALIEDAHRPVPQKSLKRWTQVQTEGNA